MLGLRRWRDRSQVERVDLYTRQSLYFFVWVLPLSLFLQSTDRLGEDPAATAVVLAGSVVVAAAGTLALRDVMTLHPALGPLPWRSIALLAATVLAAAAVMPALPRGHAVLLGTACFFVAGWSLAGLRDRRATGVLLVVGVAVPWATTGEPALGAVGLAAAAFFLFTTRTSLWLFDVVRELDRARGAQAALAVAEERLRFSRDVHDVLGRRLSAIAVQSELASTLAERGDSSAAAERMLEVRATAHDGLREARELARGYRAPDLHHELDGARSLLGAAGIDLVVRLDDLPPGWHATAAAVVREGVTNVLRHSDATSVEVDWTAPRLAVVNDRPTSATTGDGSGLAGLRERLVPLGGSLDVEHDAQRFAVVVTLPGAGSEETP